MGEVTICRRCAKQSNVILPSLRVTKLPCDNCGGHDPGITHNYSVESMQIPGTTDDPNYQAEREEAQK